MNQDAFDRFMTEQLGWIPVKALARQLMLFESEVAGLVKDVPGRDTKRHFNKTVRTPQFAPKILKRSAKVADRMMAHLAAAGVTHGEIGRAHASTPVTNAHLVCRLLLATKTTIRN